VDRSAGFSAEASLVFIVGLRNSRPVVM